MKMYQFEMHYNQSGVRIIAAHERKLQYDRVRIDASRKLGM